MSLEKGLPEKIKTVAQIVKARFKKEYFFIFALHDAHP
jgi:hypothetical protein